MDILQDKLALLRTKLDKYPIMQKAEVSTAVVRKIDSGIDRPSPRACVCVFAALVAVA